MDNQEKVVNKIIIQEKQLLSRKNSVSELGELIDDEFTEIGSSGSIFDKTEVMRWLASEDQSVRVGTHFNAQYLSENIVLLRYVSSIKEK